MNALENGDTNFASESKCSNRRILRIVLIITVVICVLLLIVAIGVFVVVPIIFMFSFNLQQALMFTRFGLPTKQEEFQLNLPGVNNFYVNVKDLETNRHISLGVWHMLPWSLVNNTIDSNTDYFDYLDNSDFNVLLHFHGTGETRIDSYKISIVLRQFFHVILFDYRGYGDSTPGLMTEQAVVDDCVQLYKWLMTKTRSKIYVWGHSLGASMLLNTISILHNEGIKPVGIFLESAFTSMWDEIPHHPYGKIFAWLPYFDSTIRYPLLENGFYFDNKAYIQNTTSPIYMFHAEDDSVIPMFLGQELHEASISPNRTLSNFVKIPAKYGCDHFWLFIYPDLPLFIEKFLLLTNTRSRYSGRSRHKKITSLRMSEVLNHK